ncbi:ABC transporter ATP-binding protein [Desulfovibrio ferrophilus]|uniref:ABC transporter n=1 Tax=Desulfovibrio ferrophilus TaxID=241368 RepID=A0A2Z6B3L0_9BACT|nr:ABC transporter ATP-binding protein [Desulfovibrio ferrophilus]BBD10035.1 ABC transporter [Desulfovibrio ferrophilus]
MLRLRNIDVFYGKIHAVKRASLHVDKGEIVALIGGNGAGKTTLLTTISGLNRPTEGTIEFDGQDITRARANTIVKLGVSHVPEGRLVFKPMKVEDNLLLGAFNRFSLKSRAKVARDIQAMYDMFPVLGERRNQAAGTLSGGEQQMLAIGRALMARPRVLLLDEPSMGLAPQITREIFRHIRELRDRFDLTVLVVEQNARMALRSADRGYVLETGRIILQGPSEELLENRDVQRAYLGRDLDVNQ